MARENTAGMSTMLSLMLEAVRTLETSVIINRNARLDFPEDSQPPSAVNDVGIYVVGLK
jgi:hypothetical protein